MAELMGAFKMQTVLLGSFCAVLSINIGSACLPSSTGNRCCDEIQSGFCFSRSGLFTADPECPSDFAPRLTLFSRNYTLQGLGISKDKIPSEFSNDRRTVYIVHGWRGSFHSEYQKLMRELLVKEDLNVIAVDWQHGASAITYTPAAANTQSVGALIGALTNSLREQPGSSPYFWCIGLSLGAQACGFSSLTAEPLLDRITGLDPAGPSFGRDKGLTKDSAANVDVIHTDPIFGSRHPRGHVDFYPNAGKNQPGCVTPLSSVSGNQDPDSMSDDEKIRALQMDATDRSDIGCSHKKALTYMIESVRDPSCFVAKQVCVDYGHIPKSCTKIPITEQNGSMGYNATNNRYHGYLYFKPSFSSPHCSTQ